MIAETTEWVGMFESLGPEEILERAGKQGDLLSVLSVLMFKLGREYEREQ